MLDVPVVVEAAPVSDTRPLRQRVLRPGAPLSSLALDGDDEPTTAHLVARAVDGSRAGEVLGTANVRREDAGSWAGDHAGLPGWRVRGMAVDEALRGTGTGRRLLDAVEAHVRAHGAPALLWCHARTPAQGFYARCGWAPVGEPWDDPDTGPHVRMVKRLD